MLTYLAQLASDRGAGRLEWSVLDWNDPAINFYKSIGAAIMEEWRICRVTGDTISRLANGS
jgi:RimJ/RimL family protein N-acetyltransferase